MVVIFRGKKNHALLGVHAYTVHDLIHPHTFNQAKLTQRGEGGASREDNYAPLLCDITTPYKYLFEHVIGS